MNLPVTVRMNKSTVLCMIRSSHRFVDDVVVVPSCHLRDRLVTDRARAALLFPKVGQGASSLQGLCHLYTEAFFQIEFPCRIVGVTISFNLVISSDRSCGGVAEPVRDPLAVFVSCCPEEAPVSTARLAKVMVGDPPCAFLRVSPLCPSPQGVEDGSVHMDKGLFG